ncbi:hypothetical protein [Brunnivagina elsteri]|uniref:hypothetical protein n=1 Tax=Brunnivagina elsteri TaxID=1247191 RepID=UPI001178AECD|nr:hypothetical protein [Calothrix elsteri]
MRSRLIHKTPKHLISPPNIQTSKIIKTRSHLFGNNAKTQRSRVLYPTKYSQLSTTNQVTRLLTPDKNPQKRCFLRQHDKLNFSRLD